MADSVSFTDLGVPDGLSQLLLRQGISEPFEVQTESIPDSLLGKDVCCRAPTGSGKTLAFGLPLITNCKQAEVRNSPTALILTPTRELAEQITTVLTPLAHKQDLEIMSIYGGTSYGKQRKALDRGVDIVVACPGRLIDLMESNDVDLSGVNIVVLDEADRMADMGFIDPVCYLLDNCAVDRQTILFSATLDDEVADLVRDYQNDPVTIEVGPKEVSMESMAHHFWLLKSSMKPDLTSEVIRRCGRTIVFCRTRRGVDRVGDDLGYDGLSIATLHGGLSQRQRDRAMEKFAEGWCDVLVATDVAARGIDVKGVECVIHYDPPENGKAYKHRSGRTARAGESGVVICFVQRAQKSSYIKIQKEVGIRYDFNPPDFSELPEIDPEALKNAKRPRRQPTHDSGRNDRG
ncbi:MAG: DEAD/DEAH box helicase, partial [Euryarchaeota archaeon]|nr:DEAD/DEAH box helicase [Euryarchaeota archaeon]